MIGDKSRVLLTYQILTSNHNITKHVMFLFGSNLIKLIAAPTVIPKYEDNIENYTPKIMVKVEALCQILLLL